MPLKYDLDTKQARILGCLIEKELSTPDYYPLSLNALTAACNQKNNRDPVMALNETQVREGLRSLIDAQLAWEKSTAGSRVTKFAHKLAGTLSRTIELSRTERALIAELLLRGPQTPGELRTRCARMTPLSEAQEVEEMLGSLAARSDGPFVRELARQPGRRESRYAECFSEAGVLAEEAPAAHPSPVTAPRESRLDTLEQRVAAIEAELAQLREQITQADRS